MFAPKVAKPQMKAAADSTDRLAPQRSMFATRPFGGGRVEQAHFLQSTLGNQATPRLLSQHGFRLAQKKNSRDHEQEDAPENIPARGATRDVQWNFSKIPLFPPDLTHGLEGKTLQGGGAGRMTMSPPQDGQRILMRISGEPVAGCVRSSGLDQLGTEDPKSNSPFIDQAAATDPDAGAIKDAGAIAGAPPVSGPGAGAGAPAIPGPGPTLPATAGPGTPTNLRQIRTSWTPGPDQYGFQLKFQCGSSSGKVADLQAQAPKLVWREYVTYSRNDFSNRFKPVDPTITPPGGVSFAPTSTKVLAANQLEFLGVTDTHWTPTSIVRAEDFASHWYSFLPGAGSRPLPAIMESSQLYQYSTDGWPGSSWTTFAGPFALKRTLSEVVPGDRSKLQFTTEKVGIQMVTEPYKP